MRLIDADALIEATQHGCVVRRKDIEDAPTVDAEPVRHGRWIAHSTELCWDVCSVCGTGCKRREEDNGADVQYNYHYCPWCGAKMDGGETRSWLSFRK